MLVRGARWPHVSHSSLARYEVRYEVADGITACGGEQDSISHARPIVDGEHAPTMEERNELLRALGEKIASGHGMVERLRLMGKIDGIDKLIRKIQQEIKFLEKVQHAFRNFHLRWD